MAEQFCKFCGQHVAGPCDDETDMMMYGRTNSRCFHASLSMAAEVYAEESIGRDPINGADASVKGAS